MEVVFVLRIVDFSLLNLSLKYEENPISGCWHIQLLIIWVRLLMEVVFILSILILVWPPELKLQIYNLFVDCWFGYYFACWLLINWPKILLIVDDLKKKFFCWCWLKGEKSCRFVDHFFTIISCDRIWFMFDQNKIDIYVIFKDILPISVVLICKRIHKLLFLWICKILFQ